MSVSNFDSYFSINDILVTEERLQVEIQHLLPKLGFLCPSSDKDELIPGTKLDFPLWLINALTKKKNSVIHFDIPKIFKDNYREILKAEACAVELNKWNQYYYELGLNLPQINVNDNNLAEFLLQVFKDRFVLIMDWEQNSSSLRGQLSVLEKQLHIDGNNGRLQLLNWLNKGVKQIKTSDVINNIRKRKRIEI